MATEIKVLPSLSASPAGKLLFLCENPGETLSGAPVGIIIQKFGPFCNRFFAL